MKKKANYEKIGVYIAAASLTILLWQVWMVLFSHVIDIKERLARVEEKIFPKP